MAYTCRLSTVLILYTLLRHMNVNAGRFAEVVFLLLDHSSRYVINNLWWFNQFNNTDTP